MTYQEVSAAVESILTNVAEFFSAQEAARAVSGQADRLLETSQALVRSIAVDTPLPVVDA